MAIDSCKLTNDSKLVTLAEMPISTCTLYVLLEYLALNQFILRFKQQYRSFYKVCLKNVFCKMCGAICGVQVAGMIFQTRSRVLKVHDLQYLLLKQ